MSDTPTLLDPTSERSPAKRERLERPKSLDGLTVGLLDISKARGDVFLDRIEQKLTEKGAKIERYAKPTFTRVAPVDLKQLISTQCDVVIEALADCGSCTSCSVHDITDLEGRGIPGGFIASTEFVEAAKAQTKALGFDTAVTYVPHPIQDRTDEEIVALADNAFDEIVAMVCDG